MYQALQIIIFYFSKVLAYDVPRATQFDGYQRNLWRSGCFFLPRSCYGDSTRSVSFSFAVVRCPPRGEKETEDKKTDGQDTV